MHQPQEALYIHTNLDQNVHLHHHHPMFMSWPTCLSVCNVNIWKYCFESGDGDHHQQPFMLHHIPKPISNHQYKELPGTTINTNKPFSCTPPQQARNSTQSSGEKPNQHQHQKWRYSKCRGSPNGKVTPQSTS